MPDEVKGSNPFEGIQLGGQIAPDQNELFSVAEPTATPILPGGQKSTSYRKGLNQWTDPFYHDDSMLGETRAKLVESGLADVQSKWDKFGNGLVKFGGSFANGILSTVGTIYGAAVSPFTLAAGGDSQLWDNPFSRLGDDISSSINENFQNYRDMSEQNASAWSPKYWATMNFFADNILGNAGYALSAYVTGAGVSKLLSGLAPYIAGKNLKAGLDIFAKEGIEGLLANTTKAYTAVKRWDATSQALSVGISASGEASTEAIQTYRETKKNLMSAATQKYGNESMIPDSVKESIENSSRSAGNMDYMMNIPILAGADMIQFGRSLSPFKSELKAFEKNPIKVKNMGGLLEGYAAEETPAAAKGFKGFITNKLPNVIKTLRSNIAEAGQEGAQYIAQEGNKNWYQRQNDVSGWQATEDYMNPYLEAAEKLFTTQEGVANLLGGFAGGSPFAVSQYIRDRIKGPANRESISADQLNELNQPFAQGTIKDNLKVYLENMARHNSAQNNLNEALARGDEHEARNAKLDIMKSYIHSRIKTGRVDLLNNELEQMRAMSNDDFKQWLNLDPSLDIDKNKVLDRFKNTAQEMHDTYKQMDRLFNPDMYRIGKLPEDEQQKKLQELDEYKSQLWNYMIDFRDREKRKGELDKEVTSAFGEALQLAPLMEDKFGNHHELNDLYRQYVAASIDHSIKKQYDPLYTGSAKETELKSLQTRLKKKLNEVGNNNPSKFLSVDAIMDDGKKDYLETYMYNIDKQIAPILSNPIVQTAMGKSDINSTITKLHDLIQIHQERRLAIHSYNQLASMIKSGSYLERFVDNPDYNEEKHKDIPEFVDGKINPEYIPKRVPSEAMLHYDGYASAKNERENFYSDLREKQDKNNAEAQQFNENLQGLINPELNDISKPYHDRAKEYQHGGEGITAPMKTMSDRHLQVLRGLIEHRMLMKNAYGEYDGQTKKQRDSFDSKDYIDTHAQLKAITDEQTARKVKVDQQVAKAADKLVTYFYSNQDTLKLEDLKPGLTIKGKVIDSAVIAKAKSIIEAKETRKAADRYEQQRQQQEAEKPVQQQSGFTSLSKPTVTEPLVTEELVGRLRNNTLSTQDANGIAIQMVNKIASGATFEDLTPNEKEFAQAYPKLLNDKLRAKGLEAISDRQLTPAIHMQVEPNAFTLDEQHAMIEMSISASVNRANNDITPVQVNDPSFLRLRRSDLEYDPKTKSNVYNEEGTVYPKQFNMDMFNNPLSPSNLNNRPPMRLKADGDRKNKWGEPIINIEVSPDGGKSWNNTGWNMQGLVNYETGKEEEVNFTRDNKPDVERIAAYKSLIKELQTKVQGDVTVPLTIRGAISYGYLISNKETDDGKQRRGLLGTNGSTVDINNPDNHNSVFIGVMANDSDKNAVGVYKDPLAQDNRLSDITKRSGIYVNPKLMNAIGGKNRAGQYFMLVPTGKLNTEKTAYEYFPVLLSGKLLNAHTSSAYDIGSGEHAGTPVNIGEILIDVLLNPHKAEYAYLWPDLFKMAGMEATDYKGTDHPETAWKDFYRNDRINNIINQVFFSDARTVAHLDEYTVPFAFEMLDTKDGSIKARVTLSDSSLADKKSVDIFIATKDGKLNKPKTGQEKDFVQARIEEEYAYRSTPEAKEKGLKPVKGNEKVSYADIQTQIKAKAYHVQIAKMSQKLSDAKPYSGFVLDNTGKLAIQPFDTYFHYVDALGLAESTIQPIKDGKGNAQYFVNQLVYLQPELREATTSKADDVLLGDTTLSPIEETKKGNEIATGVTASEDGNSTSVAPTSFINSVSAANRTNKKSLGRGKTRKDDNTKADDVLPMIDMKSIRQRSLAGADAPLVHYQESITNEISTILLNNILNRKSKAPIRIDTLKKELLASLQDRLYDLMKEGRPSLKDITRSEWDVLDDEDPNAGYLTEREARSLPEDKYRQHESLLFAIEHDDIDRFQELYDGGLLDEQELQSITTGFDEAGKPLFFIGFLNTAIAKVTELNIIQAVNEGREVIDLKDETGDYTRRFDDNWSLRVNPKSTIGMKAKIILNTIPDIRTNVDANGSITADRTVSETGFIKNIDYDAAFLQIEALGISSVPSQFEYNLIQNPLYNTSPIIRALRIRLEEVKKDDADRYKQIIRQLSHVVSHKKNGVFQITNDLNGNTRIFQGSKSNITDQIVSGWQSQFLNHAAANNYTTVTNEWDEVQKVSKTVYTLNTDFAKDFNDKVKALFDNADSYSGSNSLKFSSYVELAKLVKNSLGLELIEDDFTDPDKLGFQTAILFREFNENANQSKRDRSSLAYYIKRGDIKNFEDLFKVVLGRRVASEIRNAIKEKTYNPDEPFENSTTALDLLAKLFQPFHYSVTNAQARNINGDNEFAYVIGSMLNHEMQNLQDIDHLQALLELPLHKDDYFLNRMFPVNKITGQRQYDEQAATNLGWTEMQTDLANGMTLKKSKRIADKFEARSVGAGAVDLMSMLLYQNGQEEGQTDNRGMAWYYSPFGDSSAAHMVKFKKFAFNFEFNDGKFHLSPGDNNSVHSILYSQFRNEVNRVHAAFQLFDKVYNDAELTLDQKKAQLDEGYHYFEKDGILVPGAATRITYFGPKNYNVTEDSELYEVVNGVHVGLKSTLYTEDGELDNDKIKNIFNDIIDDFLSDVINTKLDIILPYADALMPASKPKFNNDSQKYESPEFKNMFDRKYINNVKRIFGDKSRIDGQLIKKYSGQEFETEQEALDKGYRTQLLKTVIIDQQVNHLIYLTNLLQKTADLSAFDNKGTYDSLITNSTKRLKMLGTPNDRTASDSFVNVIAYNDISYGHNQVKRTDVESHLTDDHNKMLKFLKKNKILQDIDTVIPAEFNELNAVYQMHKDKVDVVTIMRNLINSNVTDGGTVKTLREFLFQKVLEGEITDSEFGELYTKYMNPDQKVELTNKGDRVLNLKVNKMVSAGTMISNDRKLVIYKKDSELVLIPNLVKGTRMEPVMAAIHAKEDTSLKPSSGYQLVPMSALKVSNAQPVNLFDRSGNMITDSIEKATPLVYPRAISGKQVENPDGKKSTITTGTQLQKYLFTDMHESRVLASNNFSNKTATGTFVLDKPTVAEILGKDNNAVPIPEKGLTVVEMMRAMNNLLREMGNIRLQRYVDTNGLGYSISDEWKQAAHDAGYKDLEEFDVYIERLEQSKDYTERREAEELQYKKSNLVITTIGKMLNDIKQQARSKKGIDVSQLAALDHIVSSFDETNPQERLKLALTFTPGNKQYQQVLLSEMEALVTGIPINGFGGIQASAYLHGKNGVAGDTGLRGYGLKYGPGGEVVGFNTAEIAVPWIFKDKNGKLLDYNKYVNDDGSPRSGMFDNDLLHIVSYRIPNTGLNMAGRFKIVRFLDPSYGDAVLVPNIIYSQMGSDLDFDKLYNYLYNFNVDDTGKLKKVKGVLHMRQNDAMDILNTDEAKRNAVEHLLNENNPGFAQRSKRINRAYSLLQDRLAELNATEQPTDNESVKDAAFSNKKLTSIKDIEDLRTALAPVTDTKQAAELKNTFSTLIADYEAKNAEIRKYLKDNDFNIQAFLNKKPGNYVKAQSYEQLENAYQDVYHYIMNDMESLPAMLTPLTPEAALSPLIQKGTDGLSYSDRKRGNNNVINSEAFQTANRANQAAAGTNIGILAHAGTIGYLMQRANMSVGKKYDFEGEPTAAQMDMMISGEAAPIVFLNDDGTIPEETGNEDKFTGPEFKSKAYFHLPMVLRIGEKVYNIPRKLNRVGAGKYLQSMLQAYLDSTKNPDIFNSNFNAATSNATIALTYLGYEKVIPVFLTQEILQRYSNAVENDRTDVFSKNGVTGLISGTLLKAGIDPSAFKSLALEMGEAKALSMTLLDLKLGKMEQGGNRLFTVDALTKMRDQQFNTEKEGNYYIDQLFVLDMFFRVKAVGDNMLSTSARSNLEAVGLKDRTLLGVRNQLQEYRKLTYDTISDQPFLIGSERIGPWNRSMNPTPAPTVQGTAYTTFNNAFDWVYGDHNLFSDFQPSFSVLRKVLGNITGRRSLGQQERHNIHIIQYYLSNPELYNSFLDVIPEQFRSNTSLIRRTIYNGRTYEENGKNIELKPLARLIAEIKDKKDPQSGKQYGRIYPVLNKLQTKVKPTTTDPSWVYTFNTNNFQQSLAQTIPHNIALMLNDSNPEIQKIAKYMYLYYYMGGGITTPQSFGHLLPQEELFRKDGFADRVQDIQRDVSTKLDALDRAVDEPTNTYDKPYWFRYFDPAIVSRNHSEASDVIRNMYVQEMQHNPYETMAGEYTDGVEFSTDVNNPDIVRIKPLGLMQHNGKIPPASFRDKYQNVYVINSDYTSYTRYGRLGFNTFAEYSYGQSEAASILKGNAIRFETAQEVKDKVADEIIDTFQTNDAIIEDGVSKDKVIMDKVQPAAAMMELYFKQDSTGAMVRRMNETGPNVNGRELAELNTLGMFIKDYIPGDTTIIAHSVKNANKVFQSQQRRGHVTVKGLDALGAYVPATGRIDLAYEYADKNTDDPLLAKKALLHEGTHAATANVIKVLQQLADKKITKAEAANLLKLDKNGRIKNINQMIKAKQQLDDLVEYLRTNTVLKNAFVKNNGGESKRTGSIDNLKVMLSSTDEFVSYIFNDKHLRDSLKEVKYKDKTIFDRLVDFLKQVLGLDSGTAAYSAFDNVFTMLEPIKNSKIPAEGYNKEDMDKMVSANNPAEETALLDLRKTYEGVRNFDARYASPDELKIYDQLVKDGKIIC